MYDFDTIADRVEIGALRDEFTDAVMMRNYDRVASLFTPDGALRIPDIPADLTGQEEIRAGATACRRPWSTSCRPHTRVRCCWTVTPLSGRVYIQELISARDGRSGMNFAVYHDRYQRTGDGWKFSERCLRDPVPRHHTTGGLGAQCRRRVRCAGFDDRKDTTMTSSATPTTGTALPLAAGHWAIDYPTRRSDSRSATSACPRCAAGSMSSKPMSSSAMTSAARSSPCP